MGMPEHQAILPSGFCTNTGPASAKMLGRKSALTKLTSDEEDTLQAWFRASGGGHTQHENIIS